MVRELSALGASRVAGASAAEAPLEDDSPEDGAEGVAVSASLLSACLACSEDDPDASVGTLCWEPEDSWLEVSWTASGAFDGDSTGLAGPVDDLEALASELAPRLVALAPLRPGNALAAASANTPVNATLPAISQRLTLRRRYIAASRSIGLPVLGMH